VSQHKFAKFRKFVNINNSNFAKRPVFNYLTLALRLPLQVCLKDVTVIGIWRSWMLKVTRAANGELVTKLTGRMAAPVLDLKDLKLVET
jgi:hypothetical protein